MNILVISIAPIFKDYVHGGSQRVLINIMENLSKKHKIKTYCTKRPDNYKHFKINDNFEVYPILPFRQFFPFPYMTNPRNLTRIIEIVDKELEWADCLYLHADGYLLKNFLETDIPIIASYHDFVYPITLSSAFIGSFDQAILPSEYIEKCFKYSVGCVYEGVMDRVKTINNGVDSNIFYSDKSQNERIKKELGIKEGEKIILFPHRPEISKGIKETLNLLDNLLKSNIRVRLLFPEYIDCKCDDEIIKDYRLLKNEIIERGLSNNVSFFPWKPYKEMRHLYSLADVTLNIGNFVEAFGLVPFESLLCETPVIATKAGALRYVLPKNMEGVEIIEYGDMECLKKNVLKIFRSKTIDFSEVHKYIKSKFNYEEMLEKYTEVFENITKKPKLQKKQFSKYGTYTLSPWCYISEKGLYDDYQGHFVDIDKNALSILNSKKILERGDIRKGFESLIKQNIIVPSKCTK